MDKCIVSEDRHFDIKKAIIYELSIYAYFYTLALRARVGGGIRTFRP